MEHDLSKYINFVDYHSKIPFTKVRKYQNEIVSVRKNKSININELDNCLNTIKHRFKSSLYYLEIIWKQYEDAKSTDILDVESYNFLSLTSLESFFIQSRSFIESTQRYCLLYIGVEKEFDNLKGFYKLISQSQNIKSQSIERLYKEKVFKENCFGFDIRNIRDKIIHKNYIKQLNFSEEINKNVPLISNKTYDTFCQNYSNELTYFLIDWAELLFEIKWQSG